MYLPTHFPPVVNVIRKLVRKVLQGGNFSSLLINAKGKTKAEKQKTAWLFSQVIPKNKNGSRNLI